MTFTIPLWLMTGAGGFALGVVLAIRLGLWFNARQVRTAAKATAATAATKAEAVQAVMTRGPRAGA